MAAPTFIQEAETAWNSTTSPKNAGPFSVQTGDVLVAVGVIADSNGVNDNLTVSGGSLTWTVPTNGRVKVNAYCGVVIYTATATSSTSITVAFASAASPSAWFGGNVLTFRGSAGVSASAKTNLATGTPSLAITTTGANSAVVAVNGDWNAADGTTRTWRTVNSLTPTSGNGLERTYFRDAAQYTTYAAYWTDVGAAGSKTVGLSAPSGMKWAIAAVEVLGTAVTTVTLDPATETDSALPLSLQYVKTLTPATTTEAAQALLFGKVAALSPATELDAAQALSFYRAATLAPATETSSAQALSFVKNAALTPATETDGAQALSYFKSLSLTPATETDAAQALGLTLATFYTLTPATESDTSLPLVLTRIITLPPATETDSAQALSFTAGGGGGGGVATQHVRYAAGVKQPDVEGVTSNL